VPVVAEVDDRERAAHEAFADALAARRPTIGPAFWATKSIEVQASCSGGYFWNSGAIFIVLSCSSSFGSALCFLRMIERPARSTISIRSCGRRRFWYWMSLFQKAHSASV